MESEDCDTTCGCQLPLAKYTSRKKCKQFQKLANSKTALILLCIASVCFHVVISGLYSMSISTLQYRFQLSSANMGIISSVCHISAIFGMVLMIILGDQVNRPIWIGISSAFASLGCILFSIPHFIAPLYIPIEEDQINICSNVTEPFCAKSSIRNYGLVLSVAMACIGFGGVPLYSHGVAYIDENVSKAKSALYSSIFYSMAALGPAIGYVGGGATLELYTYIGQEPDGLTSSSYAWVGAWWIGYLIVGLILFSVSVFIYMLPKNMPDSKEHRTNRNNEMQANGSLDNDELNKIAASILRSLKYLLKNKCLMLCIFGNALNFAFIFGFNTFGAKYFESQFGMKPFMSSLLYGISSIFAAARAQILSGIILSKYKLNVSQIIKYMLVCSIISACCSFGLLIHCPDINFAGATVPYHENNEYELTSPCNANCTCNTDVYEPVCGADGITYFSPCFAGCSTSYNNGSYSDCNCIGNNTTDDLQIITQIQGAHAGICDQNNCTNIPLFMVFLITAMFTSVMTFTPSMQVTLRCVPFNLRVRAVSLNRILSYIFGTIPGQILTGLIVDLACAAWRTECGAQGSCVIYNKRKMARNLALILLAETWCMVVVYVIMTFVYVPHGDDTTTNEEMVDKNVVKKEEKPML